MIGPADLPVGEGSSLIVYAVGSLEDGTIDVITETIDGLHGTPGAIHTGNSPIDSSSPAWPLWPSVGLVIMAAVIGIRGNGQAPSGHRPTLRLMAVDPTTTPTQAFRFGGDDDGLRPASAPPACAAGG